MTMESPEGSGFKPNKYSPDEGTRISRMAVTAMILSIGGIVLAALGVGVIFSLVGMIMGVAAVSGVDRDPKHLAGKGYAYTGFVLGLVGLGLVCLMPPGGKSRELANRSMCASNLTLISKAMIVYANGNSDVFPMAGRPAKPGGYRNDLGVLSGTTDDAKVVEEIHVNTATSGNPTACLWMLLIHNQITPKWLGCKSDPFAGTPGTLKDASGRYFLTPQKQDQISYSITYPWNDVREAGEWWKLDGDGTRPILADMAPLQGTGKRVPIDVTKAGSAGAAGREYNSFNHGWDGQNVAYADGHAEWMRKPTAGHGGENIFAVDTPVVGAVKAGEVGTAWMRKVGPFDTVMVPLRDGGTGGVK